MRFWLLTLGTCFSLMSPSVARGWACPPGGRAAAIARAKVILVGTAIESTQPRGRDLRTTPFKLERLYKGSVPGKDKALTLHSCVGDKCGPSFKKGQRYVVFAFTDGDGRLHEQGACGGTRLITPEDATMQELLADLEKLGGKLTRVTGTLERRKLGDFVVAPGVEVRCDGVRFPDDAVGQTVIVEGTLEEVNAPKATRNERGEWSQGTATGEAYSVLRSCVRVK